MPGPTWRTGRRAYTDRICLMQTDRAGGTKSLMEFIDNGGFADTRVSGDKHEFRLSVGYNAVERREQGIDFAILARTISRESAAGLACPARPAETHRSSPHFPFIKTASKIARGAGSCLIALLSRLGEQLHDDCRDRARNTLRASRTGGTGCLAIWAVHQFHRIGTQ